MVSFISTSGCHVRVLVRLLYLLTIFLCRVRKILSVMGCGGCDDGRLMFYCDQQHEGCFVWCHYDCLGLSLAEGQRLGTFAEMFVCPHCKDINTSTLSDFDIVEPKSELSDYSPAFEPCTDFLWNDISGGEVLCQHMRKSFTGNLTFF